mgnify:CR=1 FL=1
MIVVMCGLLHNFQRKNKKKKRQLKKQIHNYKELGIKGTLQLSGVKLREVWLTGDDDFTKMSYVSTDYGTANEFLKWKAQWMDLNVQLSDADSRSGALH